MVTYNVALRMIDIGAGTLEIWSNELLKGGASVASTVRRRRLASEAVAEVAEHDAAEWPSKKVERERASMKVRAQLLRVLQKVATANPSGAAS